MHNDIVYSNKVAIILPHGSLLRSVKGWCAHSILMESVGNGIVWELETATSVSCLLWRWWWDRGDIKYWRFKIWWHKEGTVGLVYGEETYITPAYCCVKRYILYGCSVLPHLLQGEGRQEGRITAIPSVLINPATGRDAERQWGER